MNAPRSFSAHVAWLRLLLSIQGGGATKKLFREVVSLRLTDVERPAEAAIDSIREELVNSDDSIRMTDFGAGTRGSPLSTEHKPDERRIDEIYRRAAAPPVWGRFLFRLVRALRPEAVLELGTNLGVSALHIGAALQLNERGRLITIEGDPSLSAIARENLRRTGHEPIATVLTGRFDDVLPACLARNGPFDLVFIDGHHEEGATLRYFETIRPHLTPGACVAFDDIEPFRPVRKAWKRILRAEPHGGALDLMGIGLWFAPPKSSAPTAAAMATACVQ